MQIRTPKKYRGPQRRSMLSCRRLTFYLLMMALIALGIGIFLNRQVLAPIVQEALYTAVSELEGRAATMAAPPPTPTVDPRNKLVEAGNYWQQGALSQAVEIYQEVAAATPNTVETYRRIALGLINASRYDEAVTYAQGAINADPFDAEAWAISAWALDWAARPGEAIANALHALELDPDSSRAQAYLAEAYFSLGQRERAELLLDELLEADPNSAEAYRARGLIKWQGVFDYDGALDDFHTAYSMADNMNLIAVDIAIIEKDLDNFSTATEFLQQVLEADPYNARALFYLGDISLSQDGNPARAERYLQDCVDFNPSYFYCYYLLGRAQLNLGNIPDAASAFEKAIELGSEDPQHYYWAGWSQIELGNCPRALAYLEPGRRIALQSGNVKYLPDIEAVIPTCDPTFSGQDTTEETP